MVGLLPAAERLGHFEKSRGLAKLHLGLPTSAINPAWPDHWRGRVQRFHGMNHIDVTHQPRPEERAPELVEG